MNTKQLPLLLLILTLVVGCHPDEEGIYYGFDEGAFAGERYNDFTENPFLEAAEFPTSTFSIDADGAAYSNVRRFLDSGVLPPQAAVRTEELINYFALDYTHPTGAHPVAVSGEVAQCPWKTEHKLIRIGVKGKEIPKTDLPPSNIVLLIDVSGSMEAENKLELLKNGFKLLVDEFDSQDRIAIVTYAGSAGLKLEATSGAEKDRIKAAINELGAGGSTAGAEGITTAYDIAQENFIAGGNNRIIIGTDGDFNVGPSSQEELIDLIEEKRELGIFLTVLGVGTGNLNEGALEQIANNGNGNFEYIDNIGQAKKVFVDEFSKFYTVAKDVKIQVDFNPEVVKAYRLIGYENRLLESEDFEDDQKDAGEIGAGQNITALYEIIPSETPPAPKSNAFTIDFRYKKPNEDTSIPLTLAIEDTDHSFEQASEAFRFTASVAAFGLLLRASEYKGTVTYDEVKTWANGAKNYDPNGFRQQFVQLVERAKGL